RLGRALHNRDFVALVLAVTVSAPNVLVGMDVFRGEPAMARFATGGRALKGRMAAPTFQFKIGVGLRDRSRASHRRFTENEHPTNDRGQPEPNCVDT
ncbi:MAG: hypothetical protein ABGY29_16120, partial [bacterium]